ncbi:MAG: DUF2007 domain-containing protein [Tissierellia bacterium]|nr:DUF2007 domain-containing protein [Tissierellia bacterium]
MFDKFTEGKNPLVAVFSSNNSFELGVAAEILNDNDIPFVAKEKGAGGYMKVIAGGFSIYATELYVRKDDEERARELLIVLTDVPEDFELSY